MQSDLPYPKNSVPAPDPSPANYVSSKTKRPNSCKGASSGGEAELSVSCARDSQELRPSTALKRESNINVETKQSLDVREPDARMGSVFKLSNVSFTRPQGNGSLEFSNTWVQSTKSLFDISSFSKNDRTELSSQNRPPRKDTFSSSKQRDIQTSGGSSSPLTKSIAITSSKHSSEKNLSDSNELLRKNAQRFNSDGSNQSKQDQAFLTTKKTHASLGLCGSSFNSDNGGSDGVMKQFTSSHVTFRIPSVSGLTLPIVKLSKQTLTNSCRTHEVGTWTGPVKPTTVVLPEKVSDNVPLNPQKRLEEIEILLPKKAREFEIGRCVTTKYYHRREFESISKQLLKEPDPNDVTSHLRFLSVLSTIIIPTSLSERLLRTRDFFKRVALSRQPETPEKVFPTEKIKRVNNAIQSMVVEHSKVMDERIKLHKKVENDFSQAESTIKHLREKLGGENAQLVECKNQILSLHENMKWTAGQLQKAKAAALSLPDTEVLRSQNLSLAEDVVNLRRELAQMNTAHGMRCAMYELVAREKHGSNISIKCLMTAMREKIRSQRIQLCSSLNELQNKSNREKESKRPAEAVPAVAADSERRSSTPDDAGLRTQLELYKSTLSYIDSKLLSDVVYEPDFPNVVRTIGSSDSRFRIPAYLKTDRDEIRVDSWTEKETFDTVRSLLEALPSINITLSNVRNANAWDSRVLFDEMVEEYFKAMHHQDKEVFAWSFISNCQKYCTLPPCKMFIMMTSGLPGNINVRVTTGLNSLWHLLRKQDPLGSGRISRRQLYSVLDPMLGLTRLKVMVRVIINTMKGTSNAFINYTALLGGKNASSDSQVANPTADEVSLSERSKNSTDKRISTVTGISPGSRRVSSAVGTTETVPSQEDVAVKSIHCPALGVSRCIFLKFFQNLILERMETLYHIILDTSRSVVVEHSDQLEGTVLTICRTHIASALSEKIKSIQGDQTGEGRPRRRKRADCLLLVGEYLDRVFDLISPMDPEKYLCSVLDIVAEADQFFEVALKTPIIGDALAILKTTSLSSIPHGELSDGMPAAVKHTNPCFTFAATPPPKRGGSNPKLRPGIDSGPRPPDPRQKMGRPNSSRSSLSRRTSPATREDL